MAAILTEDKPKPKEAPKVEKHYLAYFTWTDYGEGKNQYEAMRIITTTNSNEPLDEVRKYCVNNLAEKKDEKNPNTFWNLSVTRKVEIIDVIDLSNEHYKVLRNYVTEHFQ